MPSTPARCIQPADPVYQDQPPRPTCGGTEYTSATTAYGSTLDRSASAWVNARRIGFSRPNSADAPSPSPSAAVASTAQVAACVYWPPFSRRPGG